MANLNGGCATVSASGQITSNSNWSCTFSGSEYTIDYNGTMTNPVPVVSLTAQDPTLTFVLNAYSGGCKVYVYQLTSNGPVPATSSFDLIVAEIM